MAGLLVGFFVGAYMHNGAYQEPNNDNKESLIPLLPDPFASLIYPDRLEIESPGKLPNTISIESIRLGAKYYRNQVLVQYLKEAGFMDLHSLGIPVKILKLCAEYTGIEPGLEELENSFKVTLYPKREGVIGEVEEQILNLLKASAKPLKTKEISDALSMA